MTDAIVTSPSRVGPVEALSRRNASTLLPFHLVHAVEDILCPLLFNRLLPFPNHDVWPLKRGLFLPRITTLAAHHC
eukprot:640144-Rhodomonas_salina.2